MKMKFDQAFVRDLVASVNITDLMRDHGVEVKVGSGKNDFFVADFCCGKTDFDNGRISKLKNVYQCKACKKGGDAITFLQTKEKVSFPKAVHMLATYANVPVSGQLYDKDEQRRYEAYELAVAFYQQHEHDYLLGRGISKEVLQKHGAGYAPGGRKLREYLESKGFTKEELQKFELVNHQGMDAFFYRVVIPVRRNGKIVSIYGRAVDDKKSRVKHFYSNGSKILFGIDDIDPNSTVILHEAIIDQLVAESFDVINGVSPGGAGKFSEYHARLLKHKGVHRVAIMFDGDDAGKEGAIEAGRLLTKQGIEVYVVELPENKDVAEILLDGGQEAIAVFTRAAKPFKEYEAFKILDRIDESIIRKYLNQKSK